jgi:small subunit ribosomal protein S16
LLRIRLQRKGRKKRPIWHIVVAERHEARDGRIVERVGRYDNVTEKKEVVLNEDRILYWLDTGAQPTDTIRKILRREGILYKRHLMNWGKSEEEIEAAMAEWKEYRDSKKEDAASRKEDHKAVLAAEEKEYKKQVQEKSKQAAAEVKAEKAAGELEKEEGPKSDADKIEEALEKAESKDAEESVEETAEVEETAAEETQDESAETPVAEAETAEEEATEEDAEPEAADAKEAAEAVEENVAEADEEPAVEEAEAEEETKDEAPEEEEAEEKEEEKEEETSGQVSTDMTAKEAIDHINDTDLEDLKGFVPDDEDRVTVQRAWESKQEG